MLFHFTVVCTIILCCINTLDFICSPVKGHLDFQFGAFWLYILVLSFGGHGHSFLLDVYLGLKFLRLYTFSFSRCSQIIFQSVNIDNIPVSVRAPVVAAYGFGVICFIWDIYFYPMSIKTPFFFFNLMHSFLSIWALTLKFGNTELEI